MGFRARHAAGSAAAVLWLLTACIALAWLWPLPSLLATKLAIFLSAIGALWLLWLRTQPQISSWRGLSRRSSAAI